MKKFSSKFTRHATYCTLFLLVFLCVSFFACKKTEVPLSQNAESSSDLLVNKSASQFSSEVIDKWMTMQLRLDRDAIGIPNVDFFRYCAYSGVAAFAAVAPGADVGASFSGKLNRLTNLPQAKGLAPLYWPASVNTALAFMNRSMFTAATATDKAAIDSLENALNNSFLSKSNPAVIALSDSFGKAVATAIFNWSDSDGYKHQSDPYTAPTGKGLWVPTPPAYAPASTPYWGNNRPIIAGSTDNTQPGPPIPYSEDPNSDFYKMVKHDYTVSQHLTQDDSAQAFFWRDYLPGVTTAGHWLSILQQVLKQTNSKLDKAAFAYALTGVCMNDASISCWQTKYHYNLVRPVTYIQQVMGHTSWLSLLSTPAHPEYSSAHCATSAAAAKALEAIFGDIGSFTDHTYDYMGFAPRTYSSFHAIDEDVAHARVLAGLHYRPSCDTALIQGRKVTANILRISGIH
jgi:hypothetical protein